MNDQNQEFIDGGSTADDAERSRPKVQDRPDDAHRRLVTLALIALLAVVILGHYIVLIIMEWNTKKVDSLNNAFNISLPVVAGLTGSAITYYFAKERRS